MIQVKEIENINDPDVSIFTSLTEAQLRSHHESENGYFIAESPKVIRVALERGYEPLALMCEQRHIHGDAADIIARCNNITVFTGERDVLAKITGYKLTRGVLCAMKRKALPDLNEICCNSSLIGVLQGITDTTNIGAIFRSASAMGVDGLVLSADTCDPLNRRAVRVSMGNVFTVPWTIIENPSEALKNMGYKTAALALEDDSISLDDKRLKNIEKLAVIFGTEGDGLPRKVIASADMVVKIPMQHDVDSLNVAAAAAVTFWELRR